MFINYDSVYHQLDPFHVNKAIKGVGLGKEFEHNVYLTVAKRMKHRSPSWSEKGSLNLCKIVCLKVSHKLSETLETISKITLPDKFNERITDVLSAGKISKKVGKGYAGKICSMPYETAAVTESRKSFRDWLKGAKKMNF